MASITYNPSGNKRPVFYLNDKGDIGARRFILAKDSLVNERLTANHTLSTTDSGRAIFVSTSGGVVTLTLPATVLGVNYHIIVDTDSSNALNISPNAADKIVGLDSGGVDNKDLILAAPKKGDYVKLLGDGVDGWFVQEASGTFTRET
ncbi:MAG: hypothetical protein QW303_01415 [Nitrososphaerota archaeon]